MCRCINMYVCPPPPLLPQGSAGLQPFMLGPFADCARPSSRFVAHSALTPSQPTFSQKLLSSPSSMGPSHLGKGLLGDSLFAIMLILALKPPGIRIRKKSSVTRNDSSWMCEGAAGGRQTPHWGPTMHTVTFSPVGSPTCTASTWVTALSIPTQTMPQWGLFSLEAASRSHLSNSCKTWRVLSGGEGILNLEIRQPGLGPRKNAKEKVQEGKK